MSDGLCMAIGIGKGERVGESETEGGEEQRQTDRYCGRANEKEEEYERERGGG